MKVESKTYTAILFSLHVDKEELDLMLEALACYQPTTPYTQRLVKSLLSQLRHEVLKRVSTKIGDTES